MKAFVLILLLCALILAQVHKQNKHVASVWDMPHIEQGTLDVIMYQSKNIA